MEDGARTRALMRPARRSFRRADRRQMRAVLVAGALALLVALGQSTPAPAAASVSVRFGEQPTGKKCVSADEARARAAGDSGGEKEDAPPKFRPAFYRRVFTLDVSLDGMDGRELPVSIEEVCDIPKVHAKDAAQLAGADGVALLFPSTSVWQGPTLLGGPAAETAIDGADTATLTVRLARPWSWREDEDGSPVATFRTRRIEVTD